MNTDPFQDKWLFYWCVPESMMCTRVNDVYQRRWCVLMKLNNWVIMLPINFEALHWCSFCFVSVLLLHLIYFNVVSFFSTNLYCSIQLSLESVFWPGADPGISGGGGWLRVKPETKRGSGGGGGFCEPLPKKVLQIRFWISERITRINYIRKNNRYHCYSNLLPRASR